MQDPNRRPEDPIPAEQNIVLAGKACLFAKVIRRDGTVEDLGLVSTKKVTAAFVNRVCSALASAIYINDFKYHASGTGTGSESNAETGMVSEYTPVAGFRPAGSQSNPAANQYYTAATVTYGSSLTITEHGVFNSAAVGGGTLMDRSILSSPISVQSGDSINFTYTFTMQPEA